jgi:serine/threonine protein kinase
VILGPGETLGRYRILEVVSIGGMAIVYRAEHLLLRGEVALKVIAPPIAGDDAFRKRFLSEGRAAAKLHHPNVVTIHYSDEVDGRLFLAMEFVRGATLADRMHAGGLTAKQTIRLLAPIADALDAAHALDIVHRDVKPQNIIISDAGHPYLTDFGIAKGVATAGFSETHGFIGTVTYAAPEQILLGRSVTAATDVYALTAVLYHCLTGRPAYLGESSEAVLHAHVVEPPPTVTPDHPGGTQLNALTARGMAKDPAARFASASELMREATGLVHTWQAIGPQERKPLEGHPATTTRPHRNGTAGQHDEALLPTTSTHDGGAADGRRPATAMTSVDTATARAAEATGNTSHRSRRIRRGHRLILGIGALIALLGAGTAAAVLRSPRPPVRPVRFTATSAPFTITYPRQWQTVSGPVVGSFAVRTQAATAHGRSLRLAFGYTTLAAGRLVRSSSIPGGVPPALAHRYGRYGTGDAVVAGHVGRKYTWSMPGGSLVAYVIALGNGDAVAICSAPDEAPGALRACGLLARNARISGAEVISPGHDAVLARTIGTALDPVVAARSSLHGLRGAPLAARAPRAARFADLESHAGAALAGLRPAARYAPEVARLAAALKDEAAQFDNLAHAAREKHRATYARDVKRVSVASRRVRAASEAFAGYRLGVPTLPVLHLASPPPLAAQHPALTGPAVAPTQSSTTTTPPSTEAPPTPSVPSYTPPAVTSPPPSTQGTQEKQSTTSSAQTSHPGNKQLGYS